MRTNNRTALISDGFCRACRARAQLFAAEDAHAAIAWVNQKTLRATAAEFCDGVLAIQADVTDVEATERAVAAAPASTKLDGGPYLRRIARSVFFFFAARVFLSGLVNSTPFQEVSLDREVLYVITSNGPLIYRWTANNREQRESMCR